MVSGLLFVPVNAGEVFFQALTQRRACRPNEDQLAGSP
jgi:hypothetical protein